MIREFSSADVMFIVMAVRWTLVLSAVAFLGGAVGGLLIALARTSGSKALRRISAGFIQVFQGTPLLMQLFLVYFGLAVVGLPIDPLLAAAVALTLHASAYLGEIWRGSIEAVPSGQTEAATALALSYPHRMRHVVLPQAMRIATAPTVGFLVQLIKGTSLASIIGFTELTRAGQIVNNATFKPFLVFGTVAILYFILCWPLSLMARRLEARMRLAVTRSISRRRNHEAQPSPVHRPGRVLAGPGPCHARIRRRPGRHRKRRHDQGRDAGRFPALRHPGRLGHARRL